MKHQMIGGITLPTTTGPPTPAEVQQIATAAYVFGYPLVLMELSKDQLTAVPAPDPDKLAAPINQFVKMSAAPSPSWESAGRPNADALYTAAWLDLKKEPMVLSVPDADDRYYLMPMYDAWTNAFASPGTRTTGSGAGNFAIVGPTWNGTLPNGLTKIESPTEMVAIAGRVLQNGPADIAAARAVQAQCALTPLSAWGTDYTPPTNVPVNPNVDTTTPPFDQVANMTSAAFYDRMAMLMVDNPPRAADKPVIDQMARIGLVAGKPFDWDGLNTTTQQAITQGAKDGLAQVNAACLHPPGEVIINGWPIMYNYGDFGTDYTLRAGTALLGLVANFPEDALYATAFADAAGNPYTGAHTYVMHFEKNGTPPVNGWWSVTMYNDRGFFVDNPIDRYAISPHLGPLQYNADGSLDFYIQHASPGPDKEANWLPAPSGGFHLVLRLYWPQEAVLNGSWVPPGVQQVK